MSVKNAKKTEKLVKSGAISHRKSSTWDEMIDIDALVKNPKRSKNKFTCVGEKSRKPPRIRLN